MTEEGRAALGLLLFATVAWTAPMARKWISALPSPPKSIYADAGSPDLLWSPHERFPFPTADGAILDPNGTPVGRIGGWKGLLLGNPLELNEASELDFLALPGIGAQRSAAIVEARERLGPFRDARDLLQVRGIGPKKIEELSALVYVRE
jgi:competence ComEA-like helix-hairpin-helix protein